MLDKKSIFGLVLSIAILVAVFYGIRAFINFDGRAASEAITKGSLEFNPSSKKDLDKYFVFVSPEEAKDLLSKARKSGSYKMLLPQFDFGTNDQPITIKEVKASVEGNDVSYLAVSGLIESNHYRSGEDGLIRGGLTGRSDAPYLWTFEVDTDKDQVKHPTRITYFPAVYDPQRAGGLSLLSRTVDETYRTIKAGELVATLMSARGAVIKEILGGDYQMSVAVTDGERYDLATFKNALLKGGKFVMVK